MTISIEWKLFMFLVQGGEAKAYTELEDFHGIDHELIQKMSNVSVRYSALRAFG